MDIFERINRDEGGPLGQYRRKAHGYYMFPKLEGPVEPYMTFQGKQVLAWTFNNYLGLANHPEVRKADAEAAAKWGLAYPMGARMMSGHTSLHERLERELADFEKKEDAYLFNFGYQGMVSTIDCLAGRHDVIVYDSESHACIMDGLRMVLSKRFVYAHNDMESFEKQLQHAQNIVAETGGGILVITEGVFGMAGDLGALDKIVTYKKKYNFRLLVDDAHGIGTMGRTGAGTGEHFGVQDQIDVYFGTFAKSFAGIGGFVAGDKEVISYLRFNLRSQIYAKSLPMAMTIGAIKRLEMMKNHPELRERLWEIANALQKGFREAGFDLGRTQSPVTPVFFNGELAQTTHLIKDLRKNYGIFCSVVIYPVVPRGVIMLRIIPTAAHTMEDVNYTLQAFKEVKKKLETNVYPTDVMADFRN